MCSDAGNNAAIGDLAAGRYLVFSDKKDGVGVGWLPHAGTLGKHDRVIGKGANLNFRLVSFDKLPVLKAGTPELVNDSICFCCVVGLGAEGVPVAVRSSRVGQYVGRQT